MPGSSAAPTASRTNSAIADDGTATRTLLLAYATFMVAIVALILFLRGDVVPAMIAAALMLIAGAILVVHVATRRPFTSSVICLTAADGQVRGWIESNLRSMPADGFVVRVSGEGVSERIEVLPDAVQRRGETLIVPFVLEGESRPRTVRVVYCKRSGSTLGKFSVRVPPR
jgi:hypothetical protein